MAVTGALMSLVGALLVLVDVIDRWRHSPTVWDAGNASTDYEELGRKERRRALFSVIGPVLVASGSALSLLAL